MTTKDIREKIEVLVDESRSKTLKEANAIKHIGVDTDSDLVILIISLGQVGGEAEKKLRRQLAKIIKLDLGFKGIKIQFEEDKKTTCRNCKFIIIGSGKGGVGRSFVTANLAYALRRQNKKVGIIDADVYGSTIPYFLDMTIKNPVVNKESMIIPFKKFGIEVMSTVFFAEKDQPVIWRGQMLNSMLNNFFSQVNWDKNLDYILIDVPAGTGDTFIDLKAFVPSAEVLLVTTPEPIDNKVTLKSGYAYQELKQNIIGIIENKTQLLSSKEIKDNKTLETSQTDEVAEKLGVEVLAKIPYTKPKEHISLFNSGEEVGQIFDDLTTLLIIRY